MASIPEYWLVDPKIKPVRLFANHSNEEGYRWADFTENNSIVSGQFEQFFLPVKELLDPPLVEELIKGEKTKIKTLEQQVQTEHGPKPNTGRKVSPAFTKNESEPGRHRLKLPLQIW